MNYSDLKKDFKKNGYIVVNIETIEKKVNQVNSGIQKILKKKILKKILQFFIIIGALE